MPFPTKQLQILQVQKLGANVNEINHPSSQSHLDVGSQLFCPHIDGSGVKATQVLLIHPTWFFLVASNYCLTNCVLESEKSNKVKKIQRQNCSLLVKLSSSRQQKKIPNGFSNKKKCE